MAIPTVNMAQIKGRIKELEEQKKNKNNGGGNYRADFFPFFAMDIGSSATVRILPDIDVNNPNIWHVNKFNHQLHVDGRAKNILCPHTFESFGECPICARADAYFKSGNREKGLYYWRGKPLGALQVLVLRHDQIKDNSGETRDYKGKVCEVTFTTQVMNAIHEAIPQFDTDKDPAFCALPTGFNFVLKSVDNGGGKAQWSFSHFERNPSTLTDEQMETIEKSLKKYSELIPPRPSIDKLQHLLDAHDGEVELDFAQFAGEDHDGNDDDGDEKPKAKKPPVAESNTVSVPVNASELSPLEPDDDDDSVLNLGGDEDEDDEDAFIKGILSRS